MIDFSFTFKQVGFSFNVKSSIPTKGITAITGPSGCGKTTLLKCLAGLEPNAKGYATFGDIIWQKDTNNIFVPPHNRNIGFVFQEGNLFPHLSVQENLNYALKRAKSSQFSCKDIISMTKIQTLLTRHTSTLSGGEKQRVSIARTILSSPKVLLMDEPMGALDNQSKGSLFPYLEQLCEQIEIPILYVSHSMDEIARLADSCIIMKQGNIVKQGNTMLLLSQINENTSNPYISILHTSVTKKDTQHELSQLTFDGGVLFVTDCKKPIGQKLKVAIHDKDVILTSQPDTISSLLNTISVKIIDIKELSKSQVLVKLQAKNSIIFSQITKKSSTSLSLKKGMNFFAQIKSVSLLS